MMKNIEFWRHSTNDKEETEASKYTAGAHFLHAMSPHVVRYYIWHVSKPTFHPVPYRGCRQSRLGSNGSILQYSFSMTRIYLVVFKHFCPYTRIRLYGSLWHYLGAHFHTSDRKLFRTGRTFLVDWRSTFEFWYICTYKYSTYDRNKPAGG